MNAIALCKSCGLPFNRKVDKGTPKQYCSMQCRAQVKRARYLSGREKRRQERGVSPMVEAVNVMAHEQMSQVG